MTLGEWMKDGKYLPKFMQDFHDQKSLFKTIHEAVNLESNEYCKDISWMSGQCYVVDIFLWYMAKRGYTLQKSRARLEFRDLDKDVCEANKLRLVREGRVLTSMLK